MSSNNIIVPIPTEIKDIKSELVFGLTKRQVTGFGIAGLVSIPTFILLKNISLDVGMYGLFIIAIPFIFTTVFTKDKLYAEKWVKNILEQKIIFKDKRLYEINPKNREVAIARGIIKDDRKKKLNSKDKRSDKPQKE